MCTILMAFMASTAAPEGVTKKPESVRTLRLPEVPLLRPKAANCWVLANSSSRHAISVDFVMTWSLLILFLVGC